MLNKLSLKFKLLSTFLKLESSQIKPIQLE